MVERDGRRSVLSELACDAATLAVQLTLPRLPQNHAEN